MELEWAENQEPEDYKFITKLDKQIESLYRELDEID
jgi:hypothetical protein